MVDDLNEDGTAETLVANKSINMTSLSRMNLKLKFVELKMSVLQTGNFYKFTAF